MPDSIGNYHTHKTNFPTTIIKLHVPTSHQKVRKGMTAAEKRNVKKFSPFQVSPKLVQVYVCCHTR